MKWLADSWMGIDPGTSGGGIAIVGTRTIKDKKVRFVETYKMPQTERDLWDLIERLHCGDRSTRTYIPNGARIAHCILEYASARPDQHAVSTFKSGIGYGFLKMALTAANVPYSQCSAQKWQNYYGMKKGKTETRAAFKNRLKAKAQQLYPKEKITLKTADALLIARYCMELRGKIK